MFVQPNKQDKTVFTVSVVAADTSGFQRAKGFTALLIVGKVRLAWNDQDTPIFFVVAGAAASRRRRKTQS